MELNHTVRDKGYLKMNDIAVFAQTDIGKLRKGNEDSFLVVDTTSEHYSSLSEIQKFNFSEQNNVFMVADGMGGPAAGEVASLLAVNTVRKEIKSKNASNESEFVQVIEDLLQISNRAIYKKAKSHSEMRGMGTTATLSGILNSKLFIGQIGDSRAYLLRKNTITQITKDQSFVNQLVETGAITEEEAETHPKKNLILQALGTQPSVKVAVTSIQLYQNDYLILCSDGLSGVIRKEEMKEIVLSSSDLASACGNLIDLANKKGGPDNITLVIAHFSSNSLAPPDQETITYKTLADFKPPIANL